MKYKKIKEKVLIILYKRFQLIIKKKKEDYVK